MVRQGCAYDEGKVQRVRPKDKKILRFRLPHWKSEVVANNKTKTIGNTDFRSTSEWDTVNLRSLIPKRRSPEGNWASKLFIQRKALS